MPRLVIYLLACVALTLVEARALPGGDVWTKDANGWARHSLSGLGCPPTLITTADNGAKSEIGSLALKDVIVGSERQPAGDQVGCDYEGKQGGWASVEITRLRPGETVARQSVAVRDRIKARFPSALRQSDSIGMRPTSPTSGDAFTVAYYNIKVGDRMASVAVAGGDVGGWMLTLVQFDYDKGATGLQVFTLTNWQMLAKARSAR